MTRESSIEGTQRVVRDGMEVVYDPRGLLAALQLVTSR